MDNPNQQSHVQQLANTTPVSTNNSSRSKIVPIGLGILFILIAIGAYVLGTKQTQLVAQSIISPTPLPTKASAKVGVDETANWKTYTNAKYDFLFRYPENLYIRSDSTDQSIGFLEILNRNDSQKLAIDVQQNPKNVSLRDFNEQLRRVGLDQINVEYQETKINGFESLIERYELPCLGICDNYKSGKHFIYFIKGRDFIVSFSVQNNNPAGNNPEEEKWLGQILSTFQFIDQITGQ